MSPMNLSSVHIVFYHCGHPQIVMTHEHKNNICPDNLPESETIDDDCYECEEKKRELEENIRFIDREGDFEMAYDDPEDEDEDEDEDADAYDGDDELSCYGKVSTGETQTRPFDPEDTLENWLDHCRLSAAGECNCIVCEFDHVKFEDTRKFRVVS